MYKKILLTPEELTSFNRNPLDLSIYVILWVENNNIPKGEKWSNVRYKVTCVPWVETVEDYLKDNTVLDMWGVKDMTAVAVYQIQ